MIDQDMVIINIFFTNLLLLLPLIVSTGQDAFTGLKIRTVLSDMPNPTPTDMPNPTQNGGATYCVARLDADVKMLQAALDWVCGSGKVFCSILSPGQPCYEPNTLAAHASYVFNAYYNRMAKAAGSCSFNGVATITTIDPSHGGCIFQGSEGSKGTFTNGTPFAPLVPCTHSSKSDSCSLCTCIFFCVLTQVLIWCYVALL